MVCTINMCQWKIFLSPSPSLFPGNRRHKSNLSMYVSPRSDLADQHPLELCSRVVVEWISHLPVPKEALGKKTTGKPEGRRESRLVPRDSRVALVAADLFSWYFPPPTPPPLPWRMILRPLDPTSKKSSPELIFRLPYNNECLKIPEVGTILAFNTVLNDN